jgi:hypothetical protein
MKQRIAYTRMTSDGEFGHSDMISVGKIKSTKVEHLTISIATSFLSASHGAQHSAGVGGV